MAARITRGLRCPLPVPGRLHPKYRLSAERQPRALLWHPPESRLRSWTSLDRRTTARTNRLGTAPRHDVGGRDHRRHLDVHPAQNRRARRQHSCR